MAIYQKERKTKRINEVGMKLFKSIKLLYKVITIRPSDIICIYTFDTGSINVIYKKSDPISQSFDFFIWINDNIFNRMFIRIIRYKCSNFF